MKKAVFIGRWQPFHLGHEWLIRQKLDSGIPVLIMIRDIPPDEKNPFTSEQSKSMVEAALDGEDVQVMIIPDIESINWGRGVGYETNEHFPPGDVKRISATDIRQKAKDGDDEWRNCVNPKVAKWLEDNWIK